MAKREIVNYSWLSSIMSLNVTDMISVIFLLDDDAVRDLQVVESLENAETQQEKQGLFKQFLLEVERKKEAEFHGLLFEVFFVMKIFKFCRDLGYSRDEVKKSAPEGYVNPVRKSLFLVAEGMNKNATCDLITRVEGSSASYCQLEKAFLNWTVNGLIAIGRDFEGSSLGTISEFLNRSPAYPLKPCVNNADEFYNIYDQSNLGYCVIINNSEFTLNHELRHLMPSKPLSSRPGSEVDVRVLKETFCQMKFSVFHHENVAYDKLRDLLSSYSRKVKASHSFFVLAVMSHGVENVIYTSDSVPVEVEDLEMAFQGENCPLLNGKPKILIVQACQGKDLQRVMLDGEASNNLVPFWLRGSSRADAVIAWSTVKGFASFRDMFQGAWFIQELCKELKENASNYDFIQIITRVNMKLRTKTYCGLTMVPSLTTSLCKKIKFR